jgi:Skp family chaperone for outer membrane proteins
MTKLNYISAVVLLAAASAAHAQTATTAPKLSGDQGAASVGKNLAKDPDNKGLQNADEQLRKNRAKHAEQLKKRSEKHEEKMEKKTEHAESHDTMERPAKIERVEKIERPGK